jgi:hypothetical protein
VNSVEQRGDIARVKRAIGIKEQQSFYVVAEATTHKAQLGPDFFLGADN